MPQTGTQGGEGGQTAQRDVRSVCGVLFYFLEREVYPYIACVIKNVIRNPTVF